MVKSSLAPVADGRCSHMENGRIQACVEPDLRQSRKQATLGSVGSLEGVVVVAPPSGRPPPLQPVEEERRRGGGARMWVGGGHVFTRR